MPIRSNGILVLVAVGALVALAVALSLPATLLRARMSSAPEPTFAAGLGLPSTEHRTAALQAPLDQAAARAVSTGSAAVPALANVFASLKLIRTAQISVEVAKYERAADEVARVAQSFGGYLAEAQTTRGQQDRQSGTLTIRVPADRFGAALAALKGLGKVRSENVSTQDVTKAYTDLETRLKVKRDTADRLRELLRTRTADLPDVLNAERELARVTEEIEEMEGERRFYDAQVAFSTIALTLAEPQALVEPGVFAPIDHALRDSAVVLAHSLAALVYVVVFLAPWMLLAYGTWRAVKAVRGRRKPVRVEG